MATFPSHKIALLYLSAIVRFEERFNGELFLLSFHFHTEGYKTTAMDKIAGWCNIITIPLKQR